MYNVAYHYLLQYSIDTPTSHINTIAVQCQTVPWHTLAQELDIEKEQMKIHTAKSGAWLLFSSIIIKYPVEYFLLVWKNIEVISFKL